MAKVLGPFHVVYGDEEFELDRHLALRKRSWKDRRVITLDGETVKEGEFLTVCESRGFEEGERAVILDNANEVKFTKAATDFVEKREASNLSTMILVVHRENALPALWATAALKGSRTQYSRFKPWEDDKVRDRIVKEAGHFKIKLEADALELLYRNLGDDLRATVNELRKLHYIVGSEGTVKREHVMLVVTSHVEIEPKDVAEAALSKNKRLLLNRLSRLFRDQGDDACVPLVSSCLYQVEKILTIRHMLDRGDSLEMIGERYEKKAFFIQKNFVPVAQKHTVKALLGHMKNLCKLEAQVKGAARSKRTLVELAVLSIAA